MTEVHSENVSDLASARIKHSVVMVTPDMAARWLESNTNNRNPRQSGVSRYRADMEAGRWEMAGDPIRFASDGTLLDGQHRLMALAELPEGTAIAFLVIRGLSKSSWRAMDQGIKRSAGDQLGRAGVRNASNVAAAAKRFIIWESGLLFRDAKTHQAISAPQIEQWVEEHPDEVEHLSSVFHLVRQNDAPPSVAGAAAIAFGRIDPAQSEHFFALLARGAGTEGHPIVTLDKRLQRNRREGLKMPDRDYLALFILAWNAWRSGKQLHKFQRPRGGRWSEEDFPEPR